MTRDNLVIVCALAVAAAAILLAWYFISISRELRHIRRETSRFPLFSVRSQLVCLVAEGKVDEDDPGWRSLYAQVNFLLRMDQKLHIVDFAWRYLRAQVQIEDNPRIQKRVEHILSAEKETAARVPEFAKVKLSANKALLFLVRERSTWFHRAIVISTASILQLLVSMFSQTKPKPRTVRMAVVRPSSATMLKWQVMEEDGMRSAA